MDELRRVMCVEDDPDIRKILEFSLGRLGGYTLSMCASGQEALDKAQAFAPDMVLLDVMMPGMSGPQTLRHLREMDCMRGIPIVFVTAKAMQEELVALLEHGASGTIVKPFDPVTLASDIHIYWEHGRGIRT
jgi:CheY-like chemotaxis protein